MDILCGLSQYSHYYTRWYRIEGVQLAVESSRRVLNETKHSTWIPLLATLHLYLLHTVLKGKFFQTWIFFVASSFYSLIIVLLLTDKHLCTYSAVLNDSGNDVLHVDELWSKSPEQLVLINWHYKFTDVKQIRCTKHWHRPFYFH